MSKAKQTKEVLPWRTTETLKLIKLYRRAKCLWDFRSANYKSPKLKENAWRQIANECGRELSIIRKKIKNLRTAYVNEKKRVDSSKNSATAEDSIYVPTLFYYSEMCFLDDVVILRHKQETDSLKVEEIVEMDYNTLTEDEATQQSVSPEKSLHLSPIHTTAKSIPSPAASELSSRASSSSSSSAQRRHSRKLPRHSKFDRVIVDPIALGNADISENVYNAFGKTIALQLQQLPLIDATITMSEIHSLVTAKILAAANDKKKRRA